MKARQQEIVLGYSGEGGRTDIVRFAAEDGTWLYRKSSVQMELNDDDEPARNGVCWVEALDLIDGHPWHLLRPTAMHPEYRDAILREVMRRALDRPDERNAEGLRRWLCAYEACLLPDDPLELGTRTIIPRPVIDEIRHAERVLVLTGAGISAESGISTFRDKLTGLWEQYNPADLADAAAFEKDPELVWGWYEWRRTAVLGAKPNAGHLAIAELGRLNPATLLVTQNVDDLHERAGSADVIHLHGELQRPRCSRCNTAYRYEKAIAEIAEDGMRIAPPRCRRCRGAVRPGVVWFGETLPESAWATAQAAAYHCDVLLAVGTSALVAPASLLIEHAKRRGALTVQINPNPPGKGAATDCWLPYGAGDALPELVRRLKTPSPP